LEAAHEIVLAEAAQRQKAEEQLRQIQKLEAIGQLTGGVAHDFNNLLMVVLGNLELIRKAVTSEARLVRLVDGALQAAKRGASLTQRLLAFARRQDLQVTAVDLRKLVTDMEDLLRRSVGPMIILDKEMPENLPHVLADANQIELALLNLAVNARDAMPDGGSLKIALAEINVAQGTRNYFCRSLCPSERYRQWERNGRGYARKGGGTVLFHQGTREGYRPRTFHDPWPGAATWGQL
jgi:signal transduction histidine kinase